MRISSTCKAYRKRYVTKTFMQYMNYNIVNIHILGQLLILVYQISIYTIEIKNKFYKVLIRLKDTSYNKLSIGI